MRALYRWACVVALPVTVAGCGTSAIGTHARAAQASGTALSEAREVLLTRHREALEAASVETAGQARDVRVRRIRDEHARWTPAGEMMDVARAALRSWVSAIALAHAADDGNTWTPHLLRAAARLAQLWNPLVRALAALGVEAPEMPPGMRALVDAAAGGE